MHIETLVIVAGLADDHEAVREALTAAAMLVMPGTVVMEPVVPPARGFEFVVITNDDAADVCSRLRHRLAEELHEREVMFAQLDVVLLR